MSVTLSHVHVGMSEVDKVQSKTRKRSGKGEFHQKLICKRDMITK